MKARLPAGLACSLPGYCLALSCANASAPPTSPPATQERGDHHIVYELGPPTEGMCRTGRPARGCSLALFYTTCGTYFSANDAELEELKKEGYLSLRFAGDHRPKAVPTKLIPSRAHQVFVGSGLLMMELGALGGVLGIEENPNLVFLPEKIAKYIAQGDDYTAAAYEASPAITRAIAGLDSLEKRKSIAKKWDAATRAEAARDEADSPDVKGQRQYGADSERECLDLLTHIVRVAFDAVQSNRRLFLVASLNHASNTCQPLDCQGFGCGTSPTSTGARTICHGPDDACQSSLDCPNEGTCGYQERTARWECMTGDIWAPQAPGAQ